MALNPDVACPHENFNAIVGVQRIQANDDDPTIVAYYAEIRITCQACEEAFRFTGVQAGLSPARPMCSPDETELRAPIRPASADPDFGLSMPGFSINVRHLDDGPHNIPPQIRDLMGREGGL